MADRIKDLMAYRFEPKREVDKLPASDESNISASEELNKSDNIFDRMRQESPTSSQEQTISDSGENASASSPWLSKASGIAAINGHFTPPSSCSSSSSSPWKPKTKFPPYPNAKKNAGVVKTVTDKEKEFQTKLRTLKQMFPEAHQDTIIQAIIKAKSSELEPAVEYMKEQGSIKKRQRIDSSSSDGLNSPIQKPKRKVMRITSDDEISSTQDDGPPLLEPQVSPEQKKRMEDLKKLKDAFPRISDDEIKSVFDEHGGNLNRALYSLSNTYSGQKADNPEKMDITLNMGSIKAIQAGRSSNISRDKFSFKGEEDDDDVILVSHSKKAPLIMRSHKKNSTIGRQVARVIDVDEEYGDDDYNSDASAEEEIPMTEQQSILQFLNEATIEELKSMPGCSKKKAEAILELRPMANWNEMANKIEESRSISIEVIGSCKAIIRIRSQVTKVMQRCETISRKLEVLVDHLNNLTSVEHEINSGYVRSQPVTMTDRFEMKPYQLVGLNWLLLMHGQDLNGILADEMGLGKTIQTIAFLTYLMEKGHKGPHLVVAPSSTIDNWLREMKVWSPKLKVLLYYGKMEDRMMLRQEVLNGTMDEFHVMLTTYNMAAGGVDDRILFKRVNFHYAIFDEGHMLKNMNAQRYVHLMKIRASRRLLLTGTPLQNNLVELMSLLAFVMPDVFNGKTDELKRMFKTISGSNAADSRGSYERTALEHAKRIMKPFVLRRLKKNVLKQLPTKTDLIEHISMAYEQQTLYDDLRAQFSADMQAAADCEETVNTSGSSMMMALRKAANHHLLHRRQFDDEKIRQIAKYLFTREDYLKQQKYRDPKLEYLIEDLSEKSDFQLHQLCHEYSRLNKHMLEDDLIVETGKFRRLDELLPQMQETGQRMLLFSQFTMMLDIMEAYLTIRGHNYLRLDGQTAVIERQELIDTFNTDNSYLVFLLSTRAGGLGINLTAASVVVLHDIDFNPYNDKQAEDRCHRVGQTRDVTVYRLISKGSIEEAMLSCAESKLQLEQDLTNDSSDREQRKDVASLLKQALALKRTEASNEEQTGDDVS